MGIAGLLRYEVDIEVAMEVIRGAPAGNPSLG